MCRIIAATPLAALLILFDLIIDNPTHPETAANLALLDVGSGHFSGLEYASQGTLPGSIASEFTQIARAYVREKNGVGVNGFSRPPESPPVGLSSSTQMPAATEASLLFSPLSHLPPVPRGSADGMVSGADVSDMFGSYFPAWDADLLFGGMAV